ncbi:DUF4846 domain-containing protein [bacterium]|nr:DUF4846 domain-containing protein [bacterium]
MFFLILFHLYLWENSSSGVSAAEKISPPVGYQRVKSENSGFENWLQNLPTKKNDKTVYLFNGQKKRNQNAQYLVYNLDVGKTDLQQCADSILRVRSEYLFSTKQFDKISFNLTNGESFDFSKWRKGNSAYIEKNRLKWKNRAENDSSYKSFRRYLTFLFMYAGTYSLQKESIQVKNFEDIKIGDFLIKGGFPGHAVLVVDMAQNEKGDKVYLLAQSFMPAQEFHILKNPNSKSPWYQVRTDSDDIETPEWDFVKSDLHRFK